MNIISHQNSKNKISLFIAVIMLFSGVICVPQAGNAVYGNTDPITIMVTFNPNKGKVSKQSKTVTVGKTYGILPTPKKNRSTFLGWYTAKSGGAKITSSTIVDTDKNLILYAHWRKESKITYTFDSNGGKVKTKTKKYKYNKKIKTVPKPKRSGYTFMGWYTKTRGGSKVDKGVKVTSQKTKMTLYARWAPKYYMQTDKKYAKKPYGKGKTVRDIGCGPTALASALYTLGNKKVTPSKACKWSYNNGYLTLNPGRTKDGFFIKYAKKYGVKVKRLNKGNLKKASSKTRKAVNKKARKAVEDGNWVIIFMTDCLWAKRGHFVLWYDVSGKNALIRDPVTKMPKRAKNKISKLQKGAVRYFVIEVPDGKKLTPEI